VLAIEICNRGWHAGGGKETLRSRTPDRYSLMVFGERLAASKWTRHDSARWERSVRLALVAQRQSG